MTEECRDATVRSCNIAVANMRGVPVREIPKNMMPLILGHRTGSPSDLPHHLHVLRAALIEDDLERDASIEEVAKKHISTFSTGTSLSPSQQHERLDSLTGLLPKKVIKGIRKVLPEARTFTSASDRATSIMEDHGQKAPFADIVKDHFTESTRGDPLTPSQQHKRLDSLAKHLPQNVIKGIRRELPEIRSYAANAAKAAKAAKINYSGQTIYLGVFTDSELEKFQNTFRPILDKLRSENASSKLVLAVVDRCREKVSFQVGWQMVLLEYAIGSINYVFILSSTG